MQFEETLKTLSKTGDSLISATNNDPYCVKRRICGKFLNKNNSKELFSKYAIKSQFNGLNAFSAASIQRRIAQNTSTRNENSPTCHLLHSPQLKTGFQENLNSKVKQEESSPSKVETPKLKTRDESSAERSAVAERVKARLESNRQKLLMDEDPQNYIRRVKQMLKRRVNTSVSKEESYASVMKGNRQPSPPVADKVQKVYQKKPRSRTDSPQSRKLESSPHRNPSTPKDKEKPLCKSKIQAFLDRLTPINQLTEKKQKRAATKGSISKASDKLSTIQKLAVTSNFYSPQNHSMKSPMHKQTSVHLQTDIPNSVRHQKEPSRRVRQQKFGSFKASENKDYFVNHVKNNTGDFTCASYLKEIPGTETAEFLTPANPQKSSAADKQLAQFSTPLSFKTTSSKNSSPMTASRLISERVVLGQHLQQPMSVAFELSNHKPFLLRDPDEDVTFFRLNIMATGVNENKVSRIRSQILKSIKDHLAQIAIKFANREDVYELIREYLDLCQHPQILELENIFMDKRANELIAKVLKVERWILILLFCHNLNSSGTSSKVNGLLAELANLASKACQFLWVWLHRADNASKTGKNLEVDSFEIKLSESYPGYSLVAKLENIVLEEITLLKYM
jgi:hypothetical protein